MLQLNKDFNYGGSTAVHLKFFVSISF